MTRSHHLLLAVDALTPAHRERIAEAVHGWATWDSIPQTAGEDAFTERLSRSTLHLGWARAEWLLRSAVELHQLPSVGYEPYVGRGLERKPGYALCNARGVMGVQVAEHGIALMLALARRLPEHVRDQAERSWRQQPAYAEVAESTACVVGMGDIGTELAKRCRGLGMRVVGVRSGAGAPHPFADSVVPLAEIGTAVAEADHIFLSLPETPETRGMFGRELLGRVKPGALLYNLARGRIVDEAALVEALASGRLAGAGLDVFETEPLPPESPLWTMPGVLVTPHVAGRSVRETDRLVDLFLDNLRRFREGAPLRNRVLV